MEDTLLAGLSAHKGHLFFFESVNSDQAAASRVHKHRGRFTQHVERLCNHRESLDWFVNTADKTALNTFRKLPSITTVESFRKLFDVFCHECINPLTTPAALLNHFIYISAGHSKRPECLEHHVRFDLGFGADGVHCLKQ